MGELETRLILVSADLVSVDVCRPGPDFSMYWVRDHVIDNPAAIAAIVALAKQHEQQRTWCKNLRDERDAYMAKNKA